MNDLMNSYVPYEWSKDYLGCNLAKINELVSQQRLVIIHMQLPSGRIVKLVKKINLKIIKEQLSNERQKRANQYRALHNGSVI